MTVYVSILFSLSLSLASLSLQLSPLLWTSVRYGFPFSDCYSYSSSLCGLFLWEYLTLHVYPAFHFILSVNSISVLYCAVLSHTHSYIQSSINHVLHSTMSSFLALSFSTQSTSLHHSHSDMVSFYFFPSPSVFIHHIPKQMLVDLPVLKWSMAECWGVSSVSAVCD